MAMVLLVIALIISWLGWFITYRSLKVSVERTNMGKEILKQALDLIDDEQSENEKMYKAIHEAGFNIKEDKDKYVLVSNVRTMITNKKKK